jgi:SAM-dependent methyltransferase
MSSTTDRDTAPARVLARQHDELWDLESLRDAVRLCDWMYEQYQPLVGGAVVEIGAGIGTFSERLAAHPDVDSLLLVEPDRACAAILARAFHDDGRVTVARETLPDSRALGQLAGRIDFLLCQNVLEHIAEERRAMRAMADALRPAGRVTILVPAHPRLYGNLDRAYGHRRRYTRERLRDLIDEAGLEIDDLYRFNLLGVPGWWLNGVRRTPEISPAALLVYEALLRVWRPLERERRPPWGLSLVAHAHKPH